MKIGFIGFGEAARAFQGSLSEHDSRLAFAAYDILLDSEGTDGACVEAMRERRVAIACPPQAELNDAEWIFSAVTADQSLEAAEAAARYVRPGQVFFDINSVSPDRRIFRTEFLLSPRSRQICLMVLPCTKWSRRTFPIVSTQIIPALASTCPFASQSRCTTAGRGQYWTPITPWRGQYWMPIYI